MKLLNHHTWKQRGWRDFICIDCGAERVWDSVSQRYLYTRFGKSYYTVPDCRFENEPIHIKL
jgi:hypothetical protein